MMLRLDINAGVAGASSVGVDPEHLRALGPRVAACLEDLRRPGPFKGWVGSPWAMDAAREAASFAASLPAGIDTAAILGIGGSSLGPLALYNGIFHPATVLPGCASGPLRRLVFLDNSDPDTVGPLLGGMDPERTLYVVITKSGSTAETASQLLVAWDVATKALGQRARDRFVFVTDPEKGDLRVLARRLGVRAFDVPPDVGGRFSVLSAVGLVPGAVCGIDPVEVLQGAREVGASCLEADLMRNPAALLAAILYLLDTRQGRHVHVVMPYSDRLAPFGAWFRQLWAESLGKHRAGAPCAGPTPLDARGATDQHSLLQLLVQGPPDKALIFLDVRERAHLAIPAGFEDLPSFGYLGGLSMEELIDAERRGTEMSLARAGTPSVTLAVDRVGPRSMGALFFVMEVATAVAGALYGVDPYDQPGVEESKKLAFGLLGRAGYEDRGAMVAAFDSARRSDLVIEV